MDLIQINTEEAQKKLTVVKRFPFEIMSLVMGLAIIYLFAGQKSLEANYRSYMMEQGKENTIQISKSTEILIEIKDVLKQNQFFLKQNNITK